MARIPVDIATLIESIPGVYGGRPRLARSGLPIIQLVAEYRSGMRVPELRDAHPHIDAESLYAGLAYYFANRAALDAELDRHDRESEAAFQQWRTKRMRARA